MSPKFWITTAGILGALGVALGAFGAHGLKNRLTPEMLSVYETGVKYWMYHTFALLAVGILSTREPGHLLSYAGWAFFLGIFLFSGSLFVLCLTGIKKFGMITPIGGTLWIAGWICLALSARNF